MAGIRGVAEQQGQGQAKGESTFVLQQFNTASLMTRAQDLHTALGRIIHGFHTNPSAKWSDLLGQFAMVNVELLNLVDDVKPILKMYVVYPKNVNAENALTLPIMLSSKLLPEMEADEAALKEQMLGGIANFSVPIKTERLQRLIESVQQACDIAERAVTESRKVHGLATRQRPVQLPMLDKLQMSRIAEQEKQLHGAANYGEGLRIPADQQQPPAVLPSHLASAFSSLDGRLSYLRPNEGFSKAPTPVPPPTGLRSNAQQQTISPQFTACVQPPPQSGGVGVDGITYSSPPQLPYVMNSPRSSRTNFNAPAPQQGQQTNQQAVTAQRARAQQQAILRHQQIQLQQQPQLRRPGTPPISQAQPQGQASQQKQSLQHLQQQQHNQNRFSQQYQQQAQQLQDRQALLSQQQQTLQQQLQSSQLQTAQNHLQQRVQVRPQMGQLGSSMTNLYGSATQNMMTSNMLQGHQYANPQQQYISSVLSDSLYNMGGSGTATQLPQNTANLGLPLQQQLPQQNYMNMFNNATPSNFGQNRQQPGPF